MCLLLALPLPRAFLCWPLAVIARQTRQAVRAIDHSIFLRCLWIIKTSFESKNKRGSIST